jgi:hypothetical protein
MQQDLAIAAAEGASPTAALAAADFTTEQGHFQQQRSSLKEGSSTRGSARSTSNRPCKYPTIYRNGKRCGPGFTEGVTGPLVCAAQLLDIGNKLAVLPGVTAPDGAGGVPTSRGTSLCTARIGSRLLNGTSHIVPLVACSTKG